MSPPPTELLLFLREVREARALPAVDAHARQLATVIEQAVQGRYVTRTETALGPVYALGLRGRRAVGLKGVYRPSEQALLNAASLHVVRQSLAQDHVIEDAGHRFAFRARKGDTSFLFVARYSGFTREGLKRLVLSLKADTPQVHLRVYVEQSALPARREGPPFPPQVRIDFHPIPHLH